MTDDYETIVLPRYRLVYIPIVAALAYSLWSWHKGQLLIPGFREQIPPEAIPFTCLSITLLLMAHLTNIEPWLPINDNLRRPLSYAVSILAFSLFFAAATGSLTL